MTFDRDNEMDFENRVIAPEYVPEDAEVENPLRPRTFADYVGQEKVRPLSGWTTVTMAGDWTGPPRLQNGTSFYYFAIDAWRYELLNMGRMCPPGQEGVLPDHPADCNAVAARLGWLPFYPQFLSLIHI